MRLGKSWAAVAVLLGTVGSGSPAYAIDTPVPETASQIIFADPPKELKAIRKAGEFRLDGRLEEKFWQEAPLARGFRQTWPKEGEAASESTWIKVAYDDEALYVGIICFDSHPDRIRRQLTRRDRSNEADYVQVAIDSYHDRQTAYTFVVNASGVERDWYVYNDNWTDDTWDGVWEAKVAHEPVGWTVEMRIPYHCLRFPQRPSHEWGIDFVRYISRNDETCRWQFVPRREASGVSRYGVLDGLEGISPPRHLQVLPYTVGKFKTEPTRLGNPDGRMWRSDVGADIKWALSPNSILDATVNPDFGQVEADATVLNLSNFEFRYPEKRPFFLEGLQLFDTPFSLFYSRRIGAAPDHPDAESDDYIIDLPEAATILYAGKLSGKTHKGLSYAMLNAVTTDEYAKYHQIDGADTAVVRERVANRGTANIARVRQDIWGNSTVGLMMTALNRDRKAPSYSGGVDWNLRTKSNVWELRGQSVVASPSSGATGWGATATIEKRSGKHIRGQMGFEYDDPNLDVNDLGFIQRNDYIGGWGWWQYRTEKTFGPIRRTWNNVNWWEGWNSDGRRLQLGGNYNFNWEFLNRWQVGGGHARDASRYDDYEIDGGPAVRLPSGYDYWMWGGTDSRRPVYFEVNYSWGTNRDGGYNDYYVVTQVRPATNLELSIAPSYNIGYSVSRYVGDIEPTVSEPAGYLFAEQNSQRFSITSRGTATFTTNLSVQFYGEVFVANVHYDHYKRLVGVGSFTPAPDLSRDETDDDPDYSILSFNANVVLRWEYRPGSTIYLVWTQARDDYDEVPSFTIRRGMNRLFDLGSNNVFMVKLNYWWNL
ncbi:MAG: DUF5916 domain-containing protein [Candidatus Zixiibacteriota bacterium]